MSERPATEAEAEIAPKPVPRTPPLRDQTWFKVLAACLAGVMIGYGLSGFAPKTPDWKRGAAQHHAMYRGWTVFGLEPSPAEQREQVQKATDAIGLPLALDDLPARTGLTFRRTQVLGFGNDRLVHAVFTKSDTTPVSLFVIARTADDGSSINGTEPIIGEMAGHGAVTWSLDDFSFIVIGGGNGDQIKGVALDIFAHIASQAAS